MKDEMMDMMDDDVENVGIMQGFLNDVEEEEGELEEEEGSEESSAARVLNRRPDSPEILMNNLRGDMRSVDARREELADLVGFQAAAETPDTVLAMLQPVLAQGGGLGALPQSGPMAQGPQPPMPPPPGGEMGEMPPGAPPLPPGGPMPPSGGDMAALLAAGPPPGGGMAPGGPAPGAGPGPMIGPDGQPIPPEGLPPIQMKDGGLVQRFSNGSTEEGVTQAGEEDLPQDRTAADILYSPELVQFAQMQAARTMAQRAQPIPTVREAMEARLPEYERLLTPDKQMSEAGLLFDVAGAALNFAANRGPRGEVLRGSPVARLAGAFSNLPAAVQKRVADIEDTKRQLRLLALQAGEKDRDEIQQLNSRLMTEQRSILNSVLTADARARAATMKGGVSPATGTRGEWEMNVFNTPGLVERFAAGQSSPQETNLINSAITSWTQPRYQAVVDPVTRQPSGYQELPGNRLPDFVKEARRMRGSGISAPGTVTLPRTETPPSAAPARDETPVETPAPLLSEGGRQPTEAGTARPTDRPVDEPTYLPREEAFAAPVSLWRDRAKIAGPFATVYAGISQAPGLGDPMREITLARSQANLLAEEAVEAFLKSSQNSVTEQKMLQGVLNLRPAFAKDPEVYGTNLIALSTVLDQVLSDYRKKANTSPGSLGATLAPEQVAEARSKISILERLKRSFDLPPAFPADPQRQAYFRWASTNLPKEQFDSLVEQEVAATLPPNVTEVLWLGLTPAKVRNR